MIVSLSIPDDLLRIIENTRGGVSRSAFICKMIREKINEKAKNEEKNVQINEIFKQQFV
jgi:metal-responsive CopG/Arc/MetJ family transcriptional regulator